MAHQATCNKWEALLSVSFHVPGAFFRNGVAIFNFIFLSHFFINFKKLSVYFASNFLNFIKLPNLFVFDPILRERQLRYIEWMGVKIYDFQKITISTLSKLYNAGLGVLISKRYHMWG